MHFFCACKTLGVWSPLYFHSFLSHQFILHIGDTQSSSTFSYKQKVWCFYGGTLSSSTLTLAGLFPVLSHWPFPMLTLGNQAPKHWFKCKILYMVLANWTLLALAHHVYFYTTSHCGSHQTHLFLCPHMALPEKARGSCPKSFALGTRRLQQGTPSLQVFLI